MAKTKVIKAKVVEAKIRKRKSKGANFPWLVYEIYNDGHFALSDRFVRKAEAIRYASKMEGIFSFCIVHVDIPPTEY